LASEVVLKTKVGKDVDKMRHSVLALAVGIIVAVFMVGCSGEDNFAASGVDMGRAGAQAANDGAVGTAFAPPTQVDIDFCQIINVNSDCDDGHV